MSHRRMVIDLLFLHKVYFGFQYCPQLLHRKSNLRPLMHNCRLLKPRNATGRLQQIWPNNVISIWNSIPENVLRLNHRKFAEHLKRYLSVP